MTKILKAHPRDKGVTRDVLNRGGVRLNSLWGREAVSTLQDLFVAIVCTANFQVNEETFIGTHFGSDERYGYRGLEGVVFIDDKGDPIPNGSTIGLFDERRLRGVVVIVLGPGANLVYSDTYSRQARSYIVNASGLGNSDGPFVFPYGSVFGESDVISLYRLAQSFGLEFRQEEEQKGSEPTAYVFIENDHPTPWDGHWVQQHHNTHRVLDEIQEKLNPTRPR